MNADSMQIMFAIIYTVFLVCISSAAGILCVKRRLFSSDNRIAVFMIGFSMTPILISLWMMLVSFLPRVYGKKWIVILLPVLISIFILVRERKSLSAIIKQVIFCHSIKRWFFIIAVFAVFAILLWKIWVISLDVRAGQDGSFYMAEALRFAKSLSFRDIASHRDFPDGSLPGSPHNFAWPAFISYALLFSDKVESIGHDFPALLSMRYTLLYLLFSLAGTAYLVFKRPEYSLFGMILYLLSPYRDFLFGSSRDFYRLIPTVLTLAVLYLVPDSRKKLTAFEISLIALLGFFSISGHPINVFWAVPLGFAGLILLIYEKTDIKTIIISAVSYTAGFLIGGYNILYAYLDAGDLSGKCSLYSENIFRGTELEDIYLNRIQNSMAGNIGFMEMLRQTFTMDQYHLVLLGAVSALLIIVWYLYKKKYEKKLLFVASNIFCLLMIMAGKVFTWGGGFSFPEWLSRNSRYTLHYYVLGIFCILTLAELLCNWFMEKNKQILTGYMITALISFIAVLLPASLKIKTRIEWEIEYFNLTYQPVIDIQMDLSEGMTMLVPGQSYPYTLNLNARVLSSYFGVPVFQAETEQELLNYLKEEKIQFVCIDKYTIDALYQYSRFYPMLRDAEGVDMIFENVNMEIFKISGAE